MEKNEKILLAYVEDKLKQCVRKNIPTATCFLDLHQQTMVSALLKKQSDAAGVLWGGYAEAERKIVCFLPDYMEQPDDTQICVIEAICRSGANLSHRDYLGAALGTGIKREQIGDIVVKENVTYILVLSDMAEYLCNQLVKAGRESLSCTVRAIAGVKFEAPDPKKVVCVSVSSLRLDKITAEGFSVSRTHAADYIRSGMVFVNQREVLKPDYSLEPFDKITLRGKGKIELDGIEGTSKKGKTRLRIKCFG